MKHDRGYRTLEIEVADAICTITLNRPDRRNAINPEMANELLWALDDAEESGEVRVIVVTGSGDHFCAGGDLGGMAEGSSSLAHKGDFAELLLRLARLEKPTIARVRGCAMGGAMGLLASLDFVIADETSSFATPEIKRGLFPFMILAPLARILRKRDLTQLILLGEKLSPARAKELGLVTEVVASADLDTRVSALASALAAQSPTAMRLGLRAFRRFTEVDMHTSIPALRDALVEILGTDDAREGLAAFMEKRAPKWTGR